MDENRRKHLEMIQSVVARLAGNSFTLKGWAVGLIAVLGSFAAKDANARFASALFFPALCFWGLDAWYLRQERLFRKLYEKAIKDDPGAPLYSMDPSPFEPEVDLFASVVFSSSVRWLHLPILAFILILVIYAAAH